MSYYESRCKVCTSPNRKAYEELKRISQNPSPWKELENKATELGEMISYKAFERHFNRHFSEEVAEFVEKEGEVAEAVEDAKKEVIDIVQEIRNNLNGLKNLLSTSLQAFQGKPVSPTMLRGLTELYREHRQSIEACERLTGKLRESSDLSQTDMLRLLYDFAKDFCPECTKKFKDKLDNYLRRREQGV